MKIAFYDTHQFEKSFYSSHGSEFIFLETKLNSQTAKLANGCEVVSAFVNDTLDRATLTILKQGGVELIALRSAGFNHVDLQACKELGIKVVYVPEYSPHAVAEHAVALILTLNRHSHHAYNRVKEGNFNLDGLVGFDLYQKTVGVIGLGKIGKVFAQIMRGFGCQVICYDQNEDLTWAKLYGCEYKNLEEIIIQSDILSLHVPLNDKTFHLINQERIGKMKDGVMLINTGRGGLIDTKALIAGLKKKKIGYAGLDVYEMEKDFFFENHSASALSDDVLARLITFPNVLLTGHQGFLTKEALNNIASMTLLNIENFKSKKPLLNQII